MAKKRWSTILRRLEAFPQPIEVPCPEGDGGRIRLTFYGYPDSRTGSVTAWCDRRHHGIWLGRVGIPAGTQTYPFDSHPEDQPEIELIPEAWYTPDNDGEDDDDLVP